MSAAGTKLDDGETPPEAVAKLLPAETRLAWQKAFVGFACDELNGVYDRLAKAVSEKAPCPPDIRDRVQAIVRALSWNRDAALGHVSSLIDDGFDRPEDAFAPAVIMLGLSPGDAKVQAWVSAQDAAVLAVIAALKKQ